MHFQIEEASKCNFHSGKGEMFITLILLEKLIMIAYGFNFTRTEMLQKRSPKPSREMKSYQSLD